MKTNLIRAIAVIGVSLAAPCALAAATVAPELGSRVMLGGVPEEKVGLRSQTAPITRIVLRPSTKDLADALATSESGEEGVLFNPDQKSTVTRAAKPMRLGPVLASNVPAREVAWEVAAKGGSVTHFAITSEGAKGVRAKLQLPVGLTQGELRVVAKLGGTAQVLPLAFAYENEIWTPPTDGQTQIVELYTPQRTAGLTFAVVDIAHLEVSPLAFELPPQSSTSALQAGSCTVDVACTIADDPVNGNAISERRKSIARLAFVVGRSAASCTGTLINSPSQQNFLVTANHCISSQVVASSLVTDWFYEASACRGSVRSDTIARVGGATMVFTNQFVDSTLLRMNIPPPPGVVFAGWNAAALTVNSDVVSLSHPKGDLMKAAFGRMSVPNTTTGLIRLFGYEQDMYGVLYSRGVIEKGSSGSGLFTLNSGSLQFRGVLSSSTLRNSPDGMSCTNTTENANYGRFDYLYPQIASTLNGTPPPADDFPNQPDASATVLAFDVPRSANLNYVGDIDSFRINISQPGTLYVKSSGGYDLIAGLVDSNGTTLQNSKGDSATNDDADSGSNDFGITWPITPGTYYLNVAPWVPTDLTPNGYRVTASFTTAVTNYTAVWWAGAAESGWGINLNHQGNIIFGTLFTYDDSGQGMWLILSRGERQPDGSYFGALYRTTGPAFNASPFNPITAGNYTEVGTMRLTFSGADNGTMVYSVSGRNVTKAITKQLFGTPPVCGFSGTNRTFNDNYQDLWSTTGESGWGINITHQSDIIFATLFTYDATGKGMWLILSRGDRIGATENFSGALYSTTGPRFDAVPFTAITAANLALVGTMRLEFPSRTGSAAGSTTAKLIYDVNGVTVTKNIQRQVFDVFRADCQKP